jgi:lia operon protein LiaG
MTLRSFPRVTSHVTVLAFLAASVASAQVERQTLSGDRVSIYNLAGKLRLQAGTGGQVSIEVTRGGRDAAQLKVESGEIRGWQTLRVVYPADRIVYPAMGYRSRTETHVNKDGTFDDGGDNDRGWFSRGRVEIRGSGSGLEAYADLVVSIPRGQRIAIHWGVGDATVTNVDGDILVSVAAASVTTEHTRGRLNLDTGSGEVSVTDAQGDVRLDTGSGRVTVNGVVGTMLDMDTGSGSIRAGDIDVKTLKADVGSGGLRLDRVKAPRIDVDAGSGHVDLDILSAIEDLHVDAGSGGITVRLPASLSADVDIETSRGGIDSDFAVETNRFERNRVRGRIGDGKGRIRIESGSGPVRLIKG